MKRVTTVSDDVRVSREAVCESQLPLPLTGTVDWTRPLTGSYVLAVLPGSRPKTTPAVSSDNPRCTQRILANR